VVVITTLSVCVPVVFATTILSDQPEGWNGVRFTDPFEEDTDATHTSVVWRINPNPAKRIEKGFAAALLRLPGFNVLAP